MISVAMATYNGARFIRRQIQSILAQSVPPDEIVITDDCSKDDTVAILRELQEQYRPLMKVSTNARRLGYARNFERAMRMSSGEIIFLSDQDNVWHPEKVERQIKADNSALLVHSDAVLVDENEKIISGSYSKFCKMDVEENSFVRILCNNPVSGCTAMIRRELIPDHIEFPEWLPHDHWLALLAADKRSLTYIPECLVSFRQHEKNVLGAGRLAAESQIQFSRAQRDSHRHDNKAKLLRKTADLARNLISTKNLRIIEDIAEYHESLGNRRNTLRAAELYLKFGRYIDFGEPWVRRTVKLLATPLRFS